MPIPTLIVHGWSDTSASFRPIARFLADNGHDVRHIFLGDYKSLQDEISLQDVGQAMHRALLDHEPSLARHSFNVVVHSTGGLVAREFLRQFCRQPDGTPDPSRSPIRNLLMLAPANFGSPLAAKGKSMVGRLFKGWKWDGPFETGTRILNALELASPISFALAESDLFDPAFPIFDPAHLRATVLTGSSAYSSSLRRIVHENGSDGTVRVSTANLNARYLKLDFANPAQPQADWVQPAHQEVAFAVLDRDHTSITKDLVGQREQWRQVVLDSLSVEEDQYSAHRQACSAIARQTFEEGRNAFRIDRRKQFHEYMHVAIRSHDQYGQPIPDYFVEFYQEEDDDQDNVMEKVHSEILEKVKVNSTDSSHRSFLFDLTDLQEALEENPDMRVEMSVIAADLTEDVRYRNPPNVATAGIRVFDANLRDFFLPNQTLLIDITLHRDAGPKVFTIKRYSP